ncbi:MAG: hypothetical protein GTO71_08515 [Woeseiaceae bacterium]|nr:hypothetical protein [Woeseiaceae bacterium]NIP21128.1 hypothetical protein [Woeseiaceae bacterium]NIS90100.1 hypothetical protein [Woeseiaceae bacterium]
MIKKTSLVGLAGLLSAAVLAADEPAMDKSTSIARTNSPPIIDGVLDDPAWAQAVVVSDLHQVKPVEYAEPSERTEFLLLYDSAAIYVGIRAFDNSPEGIVARVLRQGEGLRGDDRVRLLLSPFNDKRSGFTFLLNPNGVRLEGIYKDGDFDRDWTGIWHGDAQINDEGWTAEMKIPFKTLSFTADSDWAANFSREIVRKQEDMAWVSRNREVNPRIVGTLSGMTGLSQGKGLDIVPALSMSSSRNYVDGSDDTSIEPSLDVFYKLTPGLNASLTVNTDFSATEVDNRQVNLTRFNLFFPEKRAFFLRESDIFEFGGIGGEERNRAITRADRENGRPYFSRRIGLSTTGQPVDLIAGAKLSGRTGRWNIGAQYIRQDDFEGIDATDIFVARVSANVFQESSVGLIITEGDPRSNLDNTLVGLDYLYRNSRLPGGRQFNASFWYQQSSTTGLDGDDAAFGMLVTSPNNTGWRGSLAYREIQENFYPALGFVSRSGVRQGLANLGYTWNVNGSTIRNINMSVDAQQIDLIRGGLQSQLVEFELIEFENNSADKIKLGYRQDKERLTEPFEISEGVTIPVGTYTYGSPELRLETGSQRAVRLVLSYRDGDFYDGTIRSAETEITWKPSGHFNTQIAFRIDEVDLPQGSFTTELVSTRLDFVFSNTLSWVNLIQYDNVTNSIGLNSRLHWVPEAGRNIYLVLNHNWVETMTDNNFHSATNDFTIKADYTFRF